MQQPSTMNSQAQQQSNLAAMMWQMQMAAPNPAMMMPPWGPSMPPVSPLLNVRVDGLRFEYQLTEDDVRKVFSRYGEVMHVNVDKEGTTAQIQLSQPHQSIAAQHDLDKKQLAGMSGAFLRVEFASSPYDPMVAAQMAAAAAQNPFAAPPMMPPALPGYPMAPPIPGPSSPGGAGRPRKYTCKLEVGIENEGEFRVASRVIQIARSIWQDPKFQEHGGKTRLRGKGIGGPHEADEPLALCISCRDQNAFDKAVSYAESQLQKVHNDYKVFCQQEGKPIPELSIKVSKKGLNYLASSEPSLGSNIDIPRGERPANAPTDQEIEHFIEERNEARKAANYKKADEVREYLKQRGVVLMDEKGAKGNFNGNEVTKWRFWRP